MDITGGKKEKEECHLNLIPYTKKVTQKQKQKSNTKWIMNENVKRETVKLLEKKNEKILRT